MCSISSETTDTDTCGSIAKDPITDHIDSQYTFFSRETYHPPTQEELQKYKNPPSLESLSRDLFQVSHKACFTLIMDGDSSNKLNLNHKQYLLESHPPFATWTFLCQHDQKYKKRKAFI